VATPYVTRLSRYPWFLQKSAAEAWQKSFGGIFSFFG
jgi:hypothetical protein